MVNVFLYGIILCVLFKISYSAVLFSKSFLVHFFTLRLVLGVEFSVLCGAGAQFPFFILVPTIAYCFLKTNPLTS